MMEMSITAPGDEPRQSARKKPRSEAERSTARRLAQIWVTWLRGQGLSLKLLGRLIGSKSMIHCYLRGDNAPLPMSLAKLRAICAEYHPGGIDDELWQTGPELHQAAVEPNRVVRLSMMPRHPEAPLTRGECPTEGPCPWFGCRYHLLLTVNDNGVPKVAGDLPSAHAVRARRVDWDQIEDALLDSLDDERDSCALTVADSGAQSLEEIGARLGVTRERVRQLVNQGIESLQCAGLAGLEP